MSEVIQHINNQTPVVSFSKAAEDYLLSCLKKERQKGIRLSVKKTGCSGLSYVVDYVDSPMPEDIVLPQMKDYLICIDKSSYPYLKGINIDYVKEGLNRKLKFINPNQTGQCGCGESFTVD